MKYHYSLPVIAICLPFILWAVCEIQPTFDDYTSLQSPWWVQIADPGYFFPDSVRRPFDALLGGIVGWQPRLFPTLNHVLIILGHTASTLLVYALCQRLLVGNASKHGKQTALAINIATLFFFFSPATLGVTLACDGFNQTYAQLWGLLALWTYRPKGSRWLLCVLLAVLSKENGLAWAVVPPLVAYAFSLTDRRQAIHDVCKGLLLALAYMLLFSTLALTGMLEYAEEYSDATLMSHVKDFVQLMAYTWVPLDYVSAVYAPSRNMTIVIITALMALPFLFLLASRWRLLLTRRLLLLVACFFILVSPHLVTVVSIMHNYAALSIAAIIVATLLSSTPPLGPTGRLRSLSEQELHRSTQRDACGAFRSKNSSAPQLLNYSLFALFLAAALFTDAHHYLAARESGLLGKHLAMQAIEAADRPLQRAFVISIEDPEEPHYSSFCVRPADTFGWGLAVRHYTGYTWKTAITEAKFDHYDPALVQAVSDSALYAGNEAVWLVGHKADSLTIFSAH